MLVSNSSPLSSHKWIWGVWWIPELKLITASWLCVTHHRSSTRCVRWRTGWPDVSSLTRESEAEGHNTNFLSFYNGQLHFCSFLFLPGCKTNSTTAGGGGGGVPECVLNFRTMINVTSNLLDGKKIIRQLNLSEEFRTVKVQTLTRQFDWDVRWH